MVQNFEIVNWMKFSPAIGLKFEPGMLIAEIIGVKYYDRNWNLNCSREKNDIIAIEYPCLYVLFEARNQLTLSQIPRRQTDCLHDFSAVIAHIIYTVSISMDEGDIAVDIAYWHEERVQKKYEKKVYFRK